MELTEVVRYLEKAGVSDVILPFFLVFVVIFATLSKTNILGKKKNYNAVVALVMALAVVIPHVTHKYPNNFDVVEIFNKVLPQVSLLIVAGFTLLLLIALFGLKGKHATLRPYSLITLIILNMYIHYAYPTISQFFIVISIFIIIDSLLFPGPGNWGHFVVIFTLTILFIFHRAIGFSGQLPLWLKFLENKVTQGMITIFYVFYLILRTVTSEHLGRSEEEKEHILEEFKRGGE